MKDLEGNIVLFSVKNLSTKILAGNMTQVIFLLWLLLFYTVLMLISN